MAYTKKTWVNNKTKLNAENLNALETGLASTSSLADENATKVAAHGTTLNTLNTGFNNLSGKVDNVITNDLQGLNSQLDDHAEALDDVNTQFNNQANWNNEFLAVQQDTMEEVANVAASLSSHVNSRANPHAVTAAQVNAYDKQAIDEKLSPVAVHSVNGATAMHSTTLPNFGRFEQTVKFEITSRDSYAGNFLWRISTGSVIINNANLASSVVAQSPVSANMLLPEYTYEQLDSGISDAINITDSTMWQTFSVLPNTRLNSRISFTTAPQVMLCLENDTLKKNFFVLLGYDNSFSYCLVDNQLFIQRESHADKYMIEVPEGCSVGNLYIKNATYDASNTTFTNYYAMLDRCNLLVQDADFQGTNFGGYIYKSGTYYSVFKPLPIEESSWPDPEGSAEDNPYSVHYDYLNTAAVLSDFKISYFKNNSNLGSIIGMCPGSAMTEDEIKEEVKTTLKDLIATGIADPEESTPGLFYFKYLP